MISYPTVRSSQTQTEIYFDKATFMFNEIETCEAFLILKLFHNKPLLYTFKSHWKLK